MIYDLVIVGGGFVGMSLALALKDTGLKIALIDAKAEMTPDSRLFALSYESTQYLKQLGCFEAFYEQCTAIHTVHASYQGQFGSLTFDRELLALPALGYVIPAHALEATLQHMLLALDTLAWYRPYHLKTLTQGQEGAIMTIESQHDTLTLKAKRVIGADGTLSTVRTQLKIATETVDYRHTAIVTQIALKHPHQHQAYERLTPDGAIAILPLRARAAAVIWSSPIARAEALFALSDHAFLEALQENFGYRLGEFEQIGARTSFPLSHVKARTNLADHVLLIGNASHTVHPIFAQGLNLALKEVKIIRRCFTNGTIDLKAASQQIVRATRVNLALSRFLPWALSQTTIKPRRLVALGMLGVNHLPMIKKMLLATLVGRDLFHLPLETST